MGVVKGPDFPTGGIILGRQGIRDAYETGRGRVRVRARAHIEPLTQGKEAIVVTELPYMVKKGGDGGLIEKIADLVHDKKIPEHHRPARRDRSPRHAHGHRAQARRAAQGGAQPALQAHADAVDVRRQHGGARRRRAAHAVAARGPHGLRRSTSARSSSGARSSSWPRRRRARTSSRACSSRWTTSTRSSSSSAPRATARARAAS